MKILGLGAIRTDMCKNAVIRNVISLSYLIVPRHDIYSFSIEHHNKYVELFAVTVLNVLQF